MRRALAALLAFGMVLGAGCVFTSRPVPPGQTGNNDAAVPPPSDSGGGGRTDDASFPGLDNSCFARENQAGRDAGFARPDGQVCDPAAATPHADAGRVDAVSDAHPEPDASDASDVTDASDADVTDAPDAADGHTSDELAPGDAPTGGVR